MQVFRRTIGDAGTYAKVMYAQGLTYSGETCNPRSVPNDCCECSMRAVHPSLYSSI
jgi:hypothetical protein